MNASSKRLGRHAQQRRRMERDEHAQPVAALQPAAALAQHRHRPAEQLPRGGGAEGDDGARPHQRDLVLQPVQAGGGVALRRRLVDAAAAAQLEAEMLHRVGEIEPLARPAERGQRPVEQLSGRADEGAAAQVFLVARLLADEHQRRTDRSFAPHRLRRVAMQRAVAAARDGVAAGGEQRLALGGRRLRIDGRAGIGEEACRRDAASGGSGRPGTEARLLRFEAATAGFGSRPGLDPGAGTAPASDGIRRRGPTDSCATMRALRSPAAAASGEISTASGRLGQ